jgi:hypothetical protein
VTRTIVLTLSLVALVGVVAGCGSSPKVVTKAQYQKELQRTGTELTALGSELGRSIDISTFNGNVDKFKDGLDKAAKDLKQLKPPANVEAANKRLADSFRELAKQLDAVKEARRKSIFKARDALGKVGRSKAITDGRSAIKELQSKGYEVGALAL